MTRALAVQGDVSREADVSRLFAAVDGALGTVAVLVNSACAAHAVRRMSTARGGAGGSIATDIHASGGDPERAQRLAPSLPMQRAGSSQEVARAISWLASDAASYCTGATLDVSGGR